MFIDAFELWHWRTLLRVPWTARRSNQSTLEEISPTYSLEGLMLKLKLQNSGSWWWTGRPGMLQSMESQRVGHNWVTEWNWCLLNTCYMPRTILSTCHMKWSEVAQSCPTLCDPMDCSPPGSSVPGILQARILEWVAICFSRGSSWPRDQTYVSCIAGRCFNLWAIREACSLRE